jgi:LysR family hydrogen peroxide-inducible transcriptional activator
VAAKLRKQLPRLELMLYEYQTDVMLEKLNSGEIDVGILALPVPMDGLDSYELYKEPFMVAMPSGHRLEKRASIKVDDLHDETLLLLEDGHCLRDQALEICSGSGVNEKQDFRATSLETLRQMVASGVGITLLPELAGRGAYGNARGVVIRPFAKPVPTRTIGAVWRKSSARRPVIMALAQQIEAHAL